MEHGKVKKQNKTKKHSIISPGVKTFHTFFLHMPISLWILGSILKNTQKVALNLSDVKD